MTAGPGAWWCFMGYQKAPLRECGITRTLLPLLWSGKQRYVNQPGLAGDSVGGSVLAGAHLPCHAWADAGVILPPISFYSFETLFGLILSWCSPPYCVSDDVMPWWLIVEITLGVLLYIQYVAVRKWTPVVKMRCIWSVHTKNPFCSRRNPFCCSCNSSAWAADEWTDLWALVTTSARLKKTIHTLCQSAECHVHVRILTIILLTNLSTVDGKQHILWATNCILYIGCTFTII